MIDYLTAKELGELTGVSTTTAWRSKVGVTGCIPDQIRSLIPDERKLRNDRMMEIIVDLYNDLDKAETYSPNLKDKLEKKMLAL